MKTPGPCASMDIRILRYHWDVCVQSYRSLCPWSYATLAYLLSPGDHRLTVILPLCQSGSTNGGHPELIIALGMHATMRSPTLGRCLTRLGECCSHLISAVYHMNNSTINLDVNEGMHNTTVNRVSHSDRKSQNGKTSC